TLRIVLGFRYQYWLCFHLTAPPRHQPNECSSCRLHDYRSRASGIHYRNPVRGSIFRSGENTTSAVRGTVPEKPGPISPQAKLVAHQLGVWVSGYRMQWHESQSSA
ncbi:hypothetical protein IWW34DRAFT_639644, partial [Fusarium oxysporum f. sp. albedinis]